MTALTLVSETRCFGGWQRRYRHRSRTLACSMTFGVFLPPQASPERPVPALYWLSGLTCTDENFMQKGGAQRVAARLGLALVAPDTSPRGPDIPGDPDGAWDFGHGAGFYVDATEPPWAGHYRMHSYVVDELPAVIEGALPIGPVRGIAGHSMGGHGAIVCALRNPGRYRSLSAFAPIANPMACPWGEKAFRRLLGPDRAAWRAWDSARLIGETAVRLPLLVDQGDQDEFLITQLKPDALDAAARAVHYPLELRRQPGYDHSYYFIASFIEDHLVHHAQALIGD